MLEKNRDFASLEAALQGWGQHLEDTLRARKRKLDSLRTNLHAKTDLGETSQRYTKRLSVSLAEAREE